MTGTLKVHTICGKDYHLYTRKESCYCPNCYKTECIKRGQGCIGWTKHVVKSAVTYSESTMDVNDEPVKGPEESVPEETQNVTCSPPEKGDFVAAKYDAGLYMEKF